MGTVSPAILYTFFTLFSVFLSLSRESLLRSRSISSFQASMLYFVVFRGFFLSLSLAKIDLTTLFQSFSIRTNFVCMLCACFWQVSICPENNLGSNFELKRPFSKNKYGRRTININLLIKCLRKIFPKKIPFPSMSTSSSFLLYLPFLSPLQRYYSHSSLRLPSFS